MRLTPREPAIASDGLARAIGSSRLFVIGVGPLMIAAEPSPSPDEEQQIRLPPAFSNQIGNQRRRLIGASLPAGYLQKRDSGPRTLRAVLLHRRDDHLDRPSASPTPRGRQARHRLATQSAASSPRRSQRGRICMEAALSGTRSFARSPTRAPDTSAFVVDAEVSDGLAESLDDSKRE